MLKNNYVNLYDLDQELMYKVKGWIKSYHQEQTVYSNFLTLSQLTLVEKIFLNHKIKYFVHSPFTNGLRKTISLYNQHSNIVLLKTNLVTNSLIKHNDVLGYLLNQLQIKFEVIGDIFLLIISFILQLLKK